MWLAEPLYDVIIRGAMLIDINSWKRSLQAYGIRTREIWWTDRRVIDHVYLCLVTGYWSCLPVSCDRLLIMFTCVLWQVIDHVYLCLVAAASTLVRVRPCVGDGHQSTQVTHVNLIWIRRLEQTFSEELSRSVSNLTVTLHLPKPQTTVTETDRWDRQVSQMDKTDRWIGRVCVCLTHRDRPSIGCLLRIWTGPRALEWILSSTMCFRRW